MFSKLTKSRVHYWSSSKPADWIRGEKKPYALEWEEWNEWQEQQAQKRPIRYWISDTLLNKVQDIVYFPLDLYRTIRVYIRNRFLDKIHYLRTDLKPGSYYDLDYRIIHALFNELVIFVEVELAHLSKWKKDSNYKFVNGRCIPAAYDYFKWANHLKHQGRLTDHAKASRQIQKLYEWWKHDRPNRQHPYFMVGDIDDILDTKQSKIQNRKTHEAVLLEQQQEDEDTRMLIELIKLRKHLWT